MSWHNGKILTAEEAELKHPSKLISKYQIGEKVLLHVFNEDDSIAASIECIILAASFSSMQVKYDLGIKTDSGFYVKVQGINGHITKLNETIDFNGIISKKKPELKSVT